MTVQELIEELQQINDKTSIVGFYKVNEEYEENYIIPVTWVSIEEKKDYVVLFDD